GGVQNDLSELLFRERKRNPRQLRGTKQSIQVRIQLIEHPLGQGGGIEDRVATMNHMIVERQNHQRWIGDNAAKNARIHGVKVNRFGMDNLTEAGDGLVCSEDLSFLRARHTRIWETRSERRIKGHQLSSSGFGSVTKGTPSSASSA